MPYTVHDTSTNHVATFPQLEDAIRMVGAALSDEELRGRIVDRDREGRWAIYDGYVVKTIWIETPNRSVISFARHRRRAVAEKNALANSSASANQPVQVGA